MPQYDAPLLELRHMLLLLEASRCGTMAAAAERLNVTPSAATHRIREAERRLGVALTMRIGTRVQLTLTGQRLAQAAERIMEEAVRAEIDAVRIGRGVESVVRLGLATYRFFHWLPSFVRHLKASQPTMHVDITESAVRDPVRQVLSGAVDVAIVPGPLKADGIEVTPFVTDELVCITAPYHRLAKRKFIHAADLVKETHFTYSSMATEGFEYQRFLMPENRYPERLVVIELPEAVIEMVIANHGISILSRWAVEPFINRGDLAAIGLTEAGLPLQWNLASRDNDPAHSPQRICKEALLAWADSQSAGA